jgi:hypothetical protein
MTTQPQDSRRGTPPAAPGPDAVPVTPVPAAAALDAACPQARVQGTPPALAAFPGAVTPGAGGDHDGPGETRTDAVSPGARTWEIALPAGLKLLSLNDRLHWAEQRRRSEAIKKAAWAMALQAKVPHLERVTVTLVYDPPDLSRDRDADNLGPTLKPVIDGLALAGKIGRHVPGRRGSGDDSRYVVHSGCEIGDQPYPRGRLRVIVTEVTS